MPEDEHIIEVPPLTMFNVGVAPSGHLAIFLEAQMEGEEQPEKLTFYVTPERAINMAMVLQETARRVLDGSDIELIQTPKGGSH